MKIEVGVGGSGLWNKDEKNMVVEVLGVNAFDYLVTNSVSNENLLMFPIMRIVIGLPYLFHAVLIFISHGTLESPNPDYDKKRFFLGWMDRVKGMVAALTNKSAKSKSVYFAHCTSEMIFITHISAREVESL
ncbi:6-phosphogluconate dehydrogenase family protein [Trifolium repens]|nr:6-phosphogluconate dehydrogenase family protein [Trifolium repens]